MSMDGQMRRERSALLFVPSSPTASDGSEDEKDEPTTNEKRNWKALSMKVGCASTGMLLVLYMVRYALPLTIRWLVRLLSLVSVLAFMLAVRMLSPEIAGYAMSELVSRLGLFGEVDLKFEGVRVVPWIEFARTRKSEDDEPLLARPRARYVDSEGNELGGGQEARSKTPATTNTPLFGAKLLSKKDLGGGETSMSELPRPNASSSSIEDGTKSMTVTNRAVPWWRRLIETSRLSIEVRCKKFSMSNPRNSVDWCRDRFVQGTDIEVTLSMTLSDFFQLKDLVTYWSWRPRDQPIRPMDDGGNLPFGAVRDPATRSVRNRVMLGVIDIEKFELCDAEVAFEQCEGSLNSAAVGSALARGEIKFAAYKGNKAAKLVRERKFNRVQVDVIAARDLDQAFPKGGPHRGLFSLVPGMLGRNTNAHYAPSTFARVQARGQSRQSRTVIMNTAPVFGYKPEPMVVSDPSTVVHVMILDEAHFGDSLVGQFATTLKQLVLDPRAIDGGQGLSVEDVHGEDDEGTYIERSGWVPLRDTKWRPFNVPRFREPNRDCVLHQVNYPTDDAAARQEEVSDSCLREEPFAGYPAVMLKIRWYHSDDVADVDESGSLTALEHMKINSAETAARCGSIDNIRSMLATFPFWLDCRGGFKINGRATAHVRDLFLGNEGALERRRRKRADKRLTNADWRYALRRAISLSRIEVPFPSGPDEHGHRYKMVWCPQKMAMVPSVEEKRGFLTVESAFTRLIRGLAERVLASGRVGASLGHIVSAVSYGATHVNNPTMNALRAVDVEDDEEAENKRRKELSTFELAKKTATATKVPFGALRGYRSDRQFAIMVGMIKRSHKRMDARAIEDVVKPVRAAGILMKSSNPPGSRHRRWKAYRCVLRGATMFYFEVAGAIGPKSGVRRGEDHVIDLHRVVVDAGEPMPDDDRKITEVPPEPLLVKLFFPSEAATRCEMEVGIRLDSGVVHTVFFTIPKELYAASAVGALKHSRWASVGEDPEALRNTIVHERGAQEAKAEDESLPRTVVRIEAVAWDDEAYEAMERNLTDSLRDWRDAIVAAVTTERMRARQEIARIIKDYRRSQEKILLGFQRVDDEEKAVVPERLKEPAEIVPDRGDDYLDRTLAEEKNANGDEEFKDAISDRRGSSQPKVPEPEEDEPIYGPVQCTCRPPAPPNERKKSYPVNGAWSLIKRGRQLDTLLEVEGVSFGARMLLSSAASTVWIHVEPSGRACIHTVDGFLAHRFVGPLNADVRTKKISDEKRSPVVLDRVIMSKDGVCLRMTQKSPVSGHKFFTTEWIVKHGGRFMEVRTRWIHASVEKYGTLFSRGGDYDTYERATGARALRIELEAAG